MTTSNLSATWNHGAISNHRQTLAALLAETVRAHPERPALTYRCPRTPRHSRKRRARDWHTITWHETAQVVLETMDRLHAIADRGETVAILAGTDVRYPIVELALALSGRVIQPLYVSSSDEELSDAVILTGAAAMMVDGAQGGRARAIAAHLPVLRLDAVVPLPGFGAQPPACLPPEVEPFDGTRVLTRLDLLPLRSPQSALLYLQSTGTTGPAKVIELSEEAMLAAVAGVRAETSHPFPRFLSFLPTAHISERLLTLYVSIALAGHTWFGGGLHTLEADLSACRPTVLLAPPLVLDAMREQAVRTAQSTATGRRLAATVQRTADRAVRLGLRGMTRRPVGARLFGRSVRSHSGLTRVKDVYAGTAPASVGLQAWWEAIGMPVRNVYGQTEVAGAVSITALRRSAFDAVGVPVPGTSVAIGADDELLVRSDSAFTRYVGNPAATAATTADGWVHTGDRAFIADNGEIMLLGRMQALSRTDGLASVDTGPLIAHIAAQFSGASVACVPAAPGPGMYLYLVLHPAGVPAVELEGVGTHPIASDDPRWSTLDSLLARVDEHGLIIGAAIFAGAFAQSTGEVGPTGKPRGWRIHQLRSDQLRDVNPGRLILTSAQR